MRADWQLARMVVATAAVVAASGCELMFSPHGAGTGDDLPPGQDAPAGGPDGAVVAPCPGTVVPHVLHAIADAELDPTAATTAFGTMPTARIDGTGPGAVVALFKFDTFDVRGLNPYELRLTLHSANRQDTCGGSCGSCDVMEQTGWLGAYVADSDWVEDQVTWTRKSTGGQTWAGADLPGVDRGATEIVGDHAPGGVTDFGFTGAAAVDAWSWIGLDGNPDDRLSFLVKPRDLVVMMATTHEGTMTACASGDVTATLNVVTCE